jgi:hypothetical protein
MSEIGNVRWFGESWHAPICDPLAKVATPTAAKCVHCSLYIDSDSQGVVISASVDIDPSGRVAYHLACFLQEIGVPHA